MSISEFRASLGSSLDSLSKIYWNSPCWKKDIAFYQSTWSHNDDIIILEVLLTELVLTAGVIARGVYRTLLNMQDCENGKRILAFHQSHVVLQ